MSETNPKVAAVAKAIEVGVSHHPDGHGGVPWWRAREMADVIDDLIKHRIEQAAAVLGAQLPVTEAALINFIRQAWEK